MGRTMVRGAVLVGLLGTSTIAVTVPPAAAAATVCPAGPVAVANGSFEDPVTGPGFPTAIDASRVPGWSTDAPDNVIELWHSGYNGIPAADGNQFVELNANYQSELSQTIATTPGTELTYRVQHRGRHGIDVADILFGPEGGAPNLTVSMSDGNDQWGTHSGTYTVPAGQTRTTIGLAAVSTSTGSPSEGNFVDDVQVGTAGCVTVDKTVADLDGRPADGVLVGDQVEYTVTVANPGGAAIAGPTVLDTIPAGLEYVPESVRVIGGPNPGPRTDADDGDGVTVAGRTITVDTSTGVPALLPPGGSASLAFRATVLPGAAGSDVTNVASVSYVEPRLLQARRAVSDEAVIAVQAEPTPAPTATPNGPGSASTPAIPSAVHATAHPELPATGAPAARGAWVAVALVAAGGGLIAARRRRAG